MNEIEKISSRDNRRLVNARKVRDGKIANQIFIEGRRLVEDALRSELAIDTCFVASGFGDMELLAAVAQKADTMAEVRDSLFDSIADTSNPQGIILIAKRPETSFKLIEANLSVAALPIVVFLSQINNPSNLGAILRTAEAAGVAGVVVSSNSADVFSPKALRAAMGSSFRLPIWQGVDLTEILTWSAEKHLTATAADRSAPTTYTEINWTKPRLLVFGSEAHGLSSSELALIDEKVSIPIANQTESLNLAVSAGVVLFEARRQNSIG